MKTVKIKSALPLYACALVWILFGLFAPLYRWKYLLLAAGISVVVYILFSVIFPGRTEEVEEKVSTGDAEIDRQIEEGRAQLKALQSANDAIEDEHISNQLARMTKAGGQIFSVLEKDTSKANDVRRFMNYYLPTTKKLLDGYQQLRATGATSGNVAEAMTSVENSLEMIAGAFEKQLDNLYGDRTLDIQTDIDALETVLKAEGLHEDSGKLNLTLGGK